MAFLSYLPLLIKFAPLIKQILLSLREVPEEKREPFLRDVLNGASKRADEGDTGDYEDIING